MWYVQNLDPGVDYAPALRMLLHLAAIPTSKEYMGQVLHILLAGQHWELARAMMSRQFFPALNQGTAHSAFHKMAGHSQANYGLKVYNRRRDSFVGDYQICELQSCFARCHLLQILTYMRHKCRSAAERPQQICPTQALGTAD